jgi:hypothetical protein
MCFSKPKRVRVGRGAVASAEVRAGTCRPDRGLKVVITQTLLLLFCAICLVRQRHNSIQSVEMSALRILVPVKRVIDYAVRLSHEWIDAIGAGRGHRVLHPRASLHLVLTHNLFGTGQASRQ